jgi:hypothetical protein
VGAANRNGFILLCSLAGEQYRQMEGDEEYDLDFMKVTADTLVQALIELTTGRYPSCVLIQYLIFSCANEEKQSSQKARTLS